MISTTAKYGLLSAPSHELEQNSFASFMLPSDLRTRLEKIQNALIISNGQVSIITLARNLEKINRFCNESKLHDGEKIAVEEYKLVITESIYNYLKQQNPNYIEIEEEKTPTNASRKLLNGLRLIFVSFFTLVNSGLLWDYFGIKEVLAALFPIMPTNVLFALAFGSAIINLLIYIDVEVSTIKNILGVSLTSQAENLLNLHEKQIYLTKKINQCLLDVNIHSNMLRNNRHHEYLHCTNIAIKLNKDIENKRDGFTDFPESTLKKLLRLALIGIGGILLLIGSYYTTVGLLTLMAAPLLGTHIGWMIIGGIAIGNMVLFFMHGNGIGKIFNPTLNQFKRVKEKYMKFLLKTEEDFFHPKKLMLQAPRFTHHYENECNISLKNIKDDSNKLDMETVITTRLLTARPRRNSFT